MRKRIQLIYTIRNDDGYIEDIREIFYDMQDVIEYLRLLNASRKLVGRPTIS